MAHVTPVSISFSMFFSISFSIIGVISLNLIHFIALNPKPILDYFTRFRSGFQ